MSSPAFNRINLGRQILAARAIADLTRNAFAERAGLAHRTVKQAEEGDPAVPEETLTKICRTIEALGFEFIDGTQSVSLARHDPADTEFDVAADASMPGFVRRIYPRTLDARGLVRDLDACGVEIDNAARLVDLCATRPQPWPETFAELAVSGRKYGIRLTWRHDVENRAGVRHVLQPYSFKPETVDALVCNILSSDRLAL